MLPGVPELLRALKTRMAETIIPALPADAVFVQEQAGLMLATLDWLIDVQAEQYLYEVVENGEYLGLLAALREVLAAAGEEPEAGAPAGAVRSDEEPVPAAAVVDLDELRDRNRQLKARSAELYALIGVRCAPEQVDQARRGLGAVALRQERRERAFYRMTGFPVDAEDLRSVLIDQSRSS